MKQSRRDLSFFSKATAAVSIPAWRALLKDKIQYLLEVPIVLFSITLIIFIALYILPSVAALGKMGYCKAFHCQPLEYVLVDAKTMPPERWKEASAQLGDSQAKQAEISQRVKNAASQSLAVVFSQDEASVLAAAALAKSNSLSRDAKATAERDKAVRDFTASLAMVRMVAEGADPHKAAKEALAKTPFGEPAAASTGALEEFASVLKSAPRVKISDAELLWSLTPWAIYLKDAKDPLAAYIIALFPLSKSLLAFSI